MTFLLRARPICFTGSRLDDSVFLSLSWCSSKSDLDQRSHWGHEFRVHILRGKQPQLVWTLSAGHHTKTFFVCFSATFLWFGFFSFWILDFAFLQRKQGGMEPVILNNFCTGNCFFWDCTSSVHTKTRKMITIRFVDDSQQGKLRASTQSLCSHRLLKPLPFWFHFWKNLKLCAVFTVPNLELPAVWSRPLPKQANCKHYCMVSEYPAEHPNQEGDGATSSRRKKCVCGIAPHKKHLWHKVGVFFRFQKENFKMWPLTPPKYAP